MAQAGPFAGPREPARRGFETAAMDVEDAGQHDQAKPTSLDDVDREIAMYNSAPFRLPAFMTPVFRGMLEASRNQRMSLPVLTIKEMMKTAAGRLIAHIVTSCAPEEGCEWYLPSCLSSTCHARGLDVPSLHPEARSGPCDMCATCASFASAIEYAASEFVVISQPRPDNGESVVDFRKGVHNANSVHLKRSTYKALAEDAQILIRLVAPMIHFATAAPFVTPCGHMHAAYSPSAMACVDELIATAARIVAVAEQTNMKRLFNAATKARARFDAFSRITREKMTKRTRVAFKKARRAAKETERALVEALRGVVHSGNAEIEAAQAENRRPDLALLDVVHNPPCLCDRLIPGISAQFRPAGYVFMASPAEVTKDLDAVWAPSTPAQRLLNSRDLFMDAAVFLMSIIDETNYAALDLTSKLIAEAKQAAFSAASRSRKRSAASTERIDMVTIACKNVRSWATTIGEAMATKYACPGHAVDFTLKEAMSDPTAQSACMFFHPQAGTKDDKQAGESA